MIAVTRSLTTKGKPMDQEQLEQKAREIMKREGVGWVQAWTQAVRDSCFTLQQNNTEQIRMARWN